MIDVVEEVIVEVEDMLYISSLLCKEDDIVVIEYTMLLL
jgi:hypothetical protein